jgi:hypothetical protein
MSLPLTDEFEHLWTEALEKYKNQTDVDPLRDGIAQRIGACNSTDDVVNVLDQEMHRFKDFRAEDSRWGKLRNQVLKPVIDVILRINDVAAETASSLVGHPPSDRLLFFLADWYHSPLLEERLLSSPSGFYFRYTSVTISSCPSPDSLMAESQATKGVSERYDALLELFEELNRYLDGLSVRLSKPITLGKASRKIAIAIFVELMNVLTLTMKLLKPRKLKRLCEDASHSFIHSYSHSLCFQDHYWQSVMGNRDVQSALVHLRLLTVLEIRAMSAETQVVTSATLEATTNILQELELSMAGRWMPHSRRVFLA